MLNSAAARHRSWPAPWLLALTLAVVAGACSTTGSTPVATPLTALTAPPTSAAADTAPTAASVPPPATTTTTTTAATTTTRPTTTPYVVPVEAGVHISYARTHHDYPASDIFASPGCGTTLVSPVNGRVLQARRVDTWTREENDPATRGGLTVAILGDDGVRYYLAHMQSIDDGIEPGAEVTAGQRLGELGDTGDASACHLHFGISPPCPGPEWSVRRGVIWPWPYLDAWRAGEQRSPALEIFAWSTEHPDACAAAEADPNAALSG
ncbi:MAG: M23 family metallopeptidase [Ilumatobacteraceae bacterium]